MASHNIHFINKFSTGSQYQDYTFFAGLPRLSHNPSCSSIYSNVIKSTSLQRGQTWSLGLGPSTYAWTGHADRRLDNVACVEITSSKLAIRGTKAAPGSTHYIRNQSGLPRFDQRMSLTATSEAIAFETGNDLGISSNVVFGLATPDDEGKLKPTFTMMAAGNAIVNVIPSTKLYIAAQSSSTGSAIDAIQAQQNAAVVEFAEKHDIFGAVVVHEADGTFVVHYSDAANFDKIVGRESVVMPEVSLPRSLAGSSAPDARDLEIIQLKEQVKIMEFLISTLQKAPTLSAPSTPRSATPAAVQVSNPFVYASPVATAVNNINAITIASADPYPTKPPTTWYKAVMPFRNNPGQSRRRDIRERLSGYMQTLGYTYEGSTLDDSFVAIFSHNAGSYGNWHSVHKATQDFRNVYEALPRHLKGYVGSSDDFEVTRTTESKGLWRARGETESRVVAEPVAAPTNGLYSSQVNGAVGVHRLCSHDHETATQTPKTVRHERTPSRRSNKHVANSVSHTERLVNGDTPNRNGINGIHTPSKNKVNGANTNGSTPVGNVKKYDYKRGPDTPMEAAKRRAREVLRSQGLDEYSIGWGVNNGY